MKNKSRALSYNQAMIAVKGGDRVVRNHWNYNEMWVCQVESWHGVVSGESTNSGVDISGTSFIALRQGDGKLQPFTPSKIERDVRDWHIVRDSTPETGLNFGQAVEALKEGNKVARKGWGGYWELFKDPVCKQYSKDNYHSTFSFNSGLIVATLKDGGGCAPAQPYQADILAEDWLIIE